MRFKLLLFICRKSNLFARFMLSRFSLSMATGPYLIALGLLIYSGFFIFSPDTNHSQITWLSLGSLIGWSVVLTIFIGWILWRVSDYALANDKEYSAVIIFRNELNEWYKSLKQTKSFKSKSKGFNIKKAVENMVCMQQEVKKQRILKKFKENKTVMRL